MGKKGGGATRKERAQRTRERIQDKARELFLQRGFDATSLEMIVRAAGVSKGAFYAHYPSKASLIHEYLGTLDLDYLRRYDALSGNRDAASVLMDFTDSVAEILESRLGQDILRTVYRAQIAREITLDPFVSRDRELYRVYGEILRRGIRDGQFRTDIDCESVADHIVMAIRGMVFEWCSRSPGFDLRGELASHIGLLLEGLRAR